MADVDLEKLNQKIDSGEELTPEEKAAIDGPGLEVEDEKEIDVSKKIGDDEEEGEESEEEEDEAETDDEHDENPEEEEGRPLEETVDKKKPEGKTSEKDAPAAEAKKKEADDAATEAERKKLIEQEAEKPLDEADIANYSPTERALFFELRKERRKRQDAQRETDTLKFRDAQEKKRKELEAKKKEEEEAAKEEDPLNGLEEDELLTVGQIKKVLSGIKPKKGEPEGQYQDPVKNKLLMDNWVLRGQQKHEDLLQVLEYAQDVLGDDEDAAAEVRDVINKGGNAAIATYKLIKANPKWAKIEAGLKAKNGATDEQKKKEEEARTNKERAERIEKNKKKVVTTGSGGGGSKSGDYSIQELLDMPEDEFAKLPKAMRDKILQDL